MALIQMTGFDPSMNNWGIAKGVYCTVEEKFTIHDLDVIQPILPTGKQVRRNSKDLESGLQLSKGAFAAIQGAQAIFVEIPQGSQSARASAGYGLCIGVLASIRAMGYPFFELTPTEVKVAAVNSKTATKKEMIEWAMKGAPNAPWPMQTIKGITSVIAGKAEHMADAVAAINAGVQLNEFQQFIKMLPTNP